MKWFIVILLSINICYFGWELDKQTQMMNNVAEHSLHIPPSAERLRFLQEPEDAIATNTEGVDPKNEVAETVNDRSSMLQSIMSMMSEGDVMIRKKIIDGLTIKPSGISTRQKSTSLTKKSLCFSFGPFTEERRSKTLNDWLLSKEVDTHLRFDANEEKQYFWMYLAVDQSADRAQETIKKLQDSGIKNYQLINRGNFRNAVSLGLFAGQAAVNQRLSELKTIGYRPIVVPYQKGLPVIWVDARMNVQKSEMSNIFDGYPSQFNFIPIACDDFLSQN